MIGSKTSKNGGKKMKIRKYFDPEIETMDREELEALQLRRFKRQLKRCYQGSEFYKQKYKEGGIKPDDIRSLEDMIHLPFVTKPELLDALEEKEVLKFLQPVRRLKKDWASKPSITLGWPRLVQPSLRNVHKRQGSIGLKTISSSKLFILKPRSRAALGRQVSL
jgi:hypothetical protein